MHVLSALALLLLRWPVLVPVALASAYFAFRNRRYTQQTADRFFAQFKLGGHRGSPIEQPENTIASMAQAKQEGADLVEFDVSLTKDGVAVLLHDDTLDRTTNLSGPIRSMLHKDLVSCNCAAKFKSAVVTGVANSDLNNNEAAAAVAARELPLPTLEEIVLWAREHGMRMLFDVKDADHSLVLTLAHLFAKYDIYDHGIVCSFYPSVIYYLRRHEPKILTGLTWRRWFTSYGDLAFTAPRFHGARLLLAQLLDVAYHWSVLTWLPGFLAVDMVLTERRDISATYVRAEEAAGRRVCAWTVNDLAEASWMRNVLQIPILTDLPALASKL